MGGVATHTIPVRAHPASLGTLYMGRVRLDGRICVPLSLLDNIIIATHSYAHPGVYKTHQLIDRKCVFQEPGKDAPVKYSYAKLRKRISVVLAGCQVCQAVKSRTGLQPDTLEAYPVPEYPFSSISVDFCHLPLVSVGSVKYNSVFVIVCRLTGYVMALPCHESVTSAELASLFLTRFVTFFGLPKEISADNDKVLDAVFFSTFCELSGIEQWHSPVYRARSNGRAENAVRVAVSSLRTLLEQCGRKRKWVDILPLALWSANDTPGVTTGYSPHRLVVGRNPIGFGDQPPVSPDFGCEDTHQFFKRVQKERAFVPDQLSRMHEQKAQEFLKAHPPQRFELGDRVWLKVVRRPGEDKLDRAWVGPAEDLERLSVGRFRVAGPYGPQVESCRLKPYNPPHTHKQPALHFHSDQETLVDDDRFIIEKVLKHHTHPERRGAQSFPQPVPPALSPGQGPEAPQQGPPLDTATTVQQRGSNGADGTETDCKNCRAVARTAACRHLARDTTGLGQYRPADRTALASAVAAVIVAPVAAWPAQLLPHVPCCDTQPRQPAATHAPTAPLTAEQLYVVAAALLADSGESFVHHHGPAQIAGSIQGP